MGEATAAQIAAANTPAAPLEAPPSLSPPAAPAAKADAPAPTPEQKPAAEKKDASGSAFAALAKRERAATERETALKGRETALAARESELAELGSFRELVAKAKDDPEAVLGKFGLTFNDLQAHYLKQVQNGTADSETQRELRAIKAKLSADEKAKADAEEAAKKQQSETVAAARTEYLDKARELVQTDDRFELLRLNGDVELVAAVAEEHFSRFGKPITLEEACERVENHYVAQAKKLLSAKKLQANSDAPKEQPKTAPTPGASPASDQRPPANNPGPRTLTNELGSTPPPPNQKPPVTLDEDADWKAFMQRHASSGA